MQLVHPESATLGKNGLCTAVVKRRSSAPTRSVPVSPAYKSSVVRPSPCPHASLHGRPFVWDQACALVLVLYAIWRICPAGIAGGASALRLCLR